MSIAGEPDVRTASLEEWLAYRDHLRSLPRDEDAVSVALAIANAQIQKLKVEEGSARARAGN